MENERGKLIYHYFLAYKYYRLPIGKILKLSVVIYGDQFGRTQIRKKIEDGDNHNMLLIFVEGQIKRIHGQVCNVKEKITILINRWLRKK